MADPANGAADGWVPYASGRGRGVLAAAVLASGAAFLDSTIVNIALPTIARDLDAGFSALQWVLDAYLLTLGALLLVGGALGDMLGRRRVFEAGLIAFAATSLACGLAPSPTTLILGRALQGVAAALLIPGSLAILSTVFAPDDRARAIGAWSGLAGVSTAIGPFLGGWLVDTSTWRWAFLVNLPILATAWRLTRGFVPADGPAGGGRLDWAGAALVVVALVLLVYPLIEARHLSGAVIATMLAGGAVAAAAFVLVELRAERPMLPPALFANRVFSVANIVTFVVYGAFGGALFLVTLQLQTQLGYSALESGAAMLPVTLMLLLFSARVGGLATRFGARPFLVAGPVLAGVGLALFVRVVPGTTYLGAVLPAVLVFAVGLVLVVAPITATAIGAVEESRAGVASGTNNAVARVASLVAVAVLPLVARIDGLQTAGTGSEAGFVAGFQRACLVAGAVCVLGGLVAAVGLPRSSGPFDRGGPGRREDPARAGEPDPRGHRSPGGWHRDVPAADTVRP